MKKLIGLSLLLLGAMAVFPPWVQTAWGGKFTHQVYGWIFSPPAPPAWFMASEIDGSPRRDTIPAAGRTGLEDLLTLSPPKDRERDKRYAALWRSTVDLKRLLVQWVGVNLLLVAIYLLRLKTKGPRSV
jgi:hypothetical protein